IRATTAVSPCGRAAIRTAGARICMGAGSTSPPPYRGGLFAELGLERGDPGFEPGAFLAGPTGHVLDRVELFARDEVESAEGFLQSLARAFTRFAGHPGKIARGRVGQLDEVGD